MNLLLVLLGLGVALEGYANVVFFHFRKKYGGYAWFFQLGRLVRGSVGFLAMVVGFVKF